MRIHGGSYSYDQTVGIGYNFPVAPIGVAPRPVGLLSSSTYFQLRTSNRTPVSAERLSVPTLGDFVRVRRGRATSERPGGMTRQVLAEAIHSSIGYVAKIEQGGAGSPSPQVLDALVEVLHLDAGERIHLYHLARQRASRARVAEPVSATPLMRGTLDALSPNPALCLDSAWNVVECNDASEDALPGLATSGNVLRWLFTEARARLVVEDWEAEAGSAVARYRGVAGALSGHAGIAAILDELGSVPDFRRMWHDGGVSFERADPTMTLRNPSTGAIYDVGVQHLATVPYRDLLLVVLLFEPDVTSGRGTSSQQR